MTPRENFSFVLKIDKQALRPADHPAEQNMT